MKKKLRVKVVNKTTAYLWGRPRKAIRLKAKADLVAIDFDLKKDGRRDILMY